MHHFDVTGHKYYANLRNRPTVSAVKTSSVHISSLTFTLPWALLLTKTFVLLTNFIQMATMAAGPGESVLFLQLFSSIGILLFEVSQQGMDPFIGCLHGLVKVLPVVSIATYVATQRNGINYF